MSPRSSTNVALLSLVTLACSGATHAADPTPAAPVEEARAATPPECNVSYVDGNEEHTLDAEGRVVRFYQSSDAAGAQWAADYEYDARGRRVRIRGELIEGMGELGPSPPIEPTYTEDETAHTVVVDYPENPPERVRWTYDERGLPIRRELLDEEGEPRSTYECTYDERGRVIGRGEARFEYRGDAALPFAMDDGEPYTITATPGHIRVRVVERPEPYEGEEDSFVDGDMDWSGECADLFFRPCARTSAPPPPGRTRASVSTGDP